MATCSVKSAGKRYHAQRKYLATSFKHDQRIDPLQLGGGGGGGNGFQLLLCPPERAALTPLPTHLNFANQIPREIKRLTKKDMTMEKKVTGSFQLYRFYKFFFMFSFIQSSLKFVEILLVSTAQCLFPSSHVTYACNRTNIQDLVISYNISCIFPFLTHLHKNSVHIHCYK